MTKHGGKRKNQTGRPKGSLCQKTIDAKKAEQLMKQMILKKLTPLVNAQVQLAQGCTFLYKIEEDEDDKKKRKHVLVTNPKEIELVMNETDGEGGNVGGDYYYMTTKAPENQAINSLVDRVFGKARQNIGLDGGEDNSPIKVMHEIEQTLRSIANKK